MTEARVWQVPAQAEKRRLDHFLVETGECGSRSQIGRLIAGGLVRVDGRAAKAGMLLRAGQSVTVEKPPGGRPATSGPEAIALRIVYEDEWLIAVDKPPGMVVHPAPGHWSGTLVNALLHRWQGDDRGLDVDRCGIVHRLDKDTSGLVLVAKDMATHEALARSFRRREVRKQYTALVHGAVTGELGEIDAPIGRHARDRKKMAVRQGGRAALTRYRVAERFRGATLLRVYPVTGRTHQIRVHLASMGHPVLADPVYAAGRSGPRCGLCRQALHAERLRLIHPHTAADLRLRAAWPEDLAAAVAQLRAAAPG